VILREVQQRWMPMWRANPPSGADYHLIGPIEKTLFRTRRECRQWIQIEYGYIARRKDLRVAPCWWRMPIPVRVRITAETL
jgi:hypothetical protein